ncbi:MAG: hypothetical protein R3E04_09820 [Sphingobium sp.]
MSGKPQISALQRVLVAAAGGARERAERLFALDNECAHIARVATEPMMAQIRLAWWRDGIMAQTLPAEHRSQDMEALRALDGFADMRAHLVVMIDGWEELILFDGADVDTMLETYAKGRGEGLFAAFLQTGDDGRAAAGRLWALWDLAGHLSDEGLAAKAVAQAADLAGGITDSRAYPRMLAMMASAARRDALRGQGAPADLTPALYLHLLRMQFFGR